MDATYVGLAGEAGQVTTAIQAAGTLLVAVVLGLLARDVPGRYVRYWAAGWAALTVALVAFNLASLVGSLTPGSGRVVRAGLAVYCLAEYLFGFLLWAGCRAYARHPAPLRPADAGLIIPPAALGLVAPAFLPSHDLLFPAHATVFGGFCLLALLATLPARPAGRQTAVGLRLLQAALLGLVVLFGQYAAVTGWAAARDPGREFLYLRYSALYDGLVGTVLAFGMVVLAADGVRRAVEAANRDLAEANRRLAEASEQLAVAARTDPLTGLLNRRAFEALAVERARGPFAGAVAVLDLNDLKPLNDTLGHAAGDAALRLVGRAMRNAFRITDPVFRTGGDEFVAVLEGGRAADLAGRLGGVDAALRGVRLPGAGDPVDLVVAWGLADFASADEFPPALHRADAAMYQCKAARKRRPAPAPNGAG